MEGIRYFTSNEHETHTVWHMALEPGDTKLQDIIVSDIYFGDLDLIAGLMSASKVNAKPFDYKDSGFLLMYDGNSQRPYPSIMIWKYKIVGDENIITDMKMEDGWIIEPIWRYYLMSEEAEEEEYIPPKQFLIMSRPNF